MDDLEYFVNENIISKGEGDSWEEVYNSLPKIPGFDEMIGQENTEGATGTHNKLVGAEFCIIDNKGVKLIVKIVKIVKDNYGVIIGTVSDNIYDNRSLYEVKYPDGETAESNYNFITDNMISQVYSHGIIAK